MRKRIRITVHIQPEQPVTIPGIRTPTRPRLPRYRRDNYDETGDAPEADLFCSHLISHPDPRLWTSDHIVYGSSSPKSSFHPAAYG